jgi:hypothetical protein
MTLATTSKLGLRYNAPSSLMGAVVATNGAVVLLFVNKPTFDALPTKSVIAGASDLPNLHRNVCEFRAENMRTHNETRTVVVLLSASKHKGHMSFPVSKDATGANWSNMARRCSVC